jgi:hypothetical protein
MNIENEMLGSVFCYTTKTNEEKQYVAVDYSLCQYNNLYKSYEFYNDKFPSGYDNIPGFSMIIDKLVEHSESNSPIDEYNKRIENKE